MFLLLLLLLLLRRWPAELYPQHVCKYRMNGEDGEVRWLGRSDGGDWMRARHLG